MTTLKEKIQERALKKKGYVMVSMVTLPNLGHLFGRINKDLFFMNRCELGSLYHKTKYSNSSLSLSDVEINIGDKIYSSGLFKESFFYDLVQEKLLLEKDKGKQPCFVVRDIIEDIIIFASI